MLIYWHIIGSPWTSPQSKRKKSEQLHKGISIFPLSLEPELCRSVIQPIMNDQSIWQSFKKCVTVKDTQPLTDTSQNTPLRLHAHSIILATFRSSSGSPLSGVFSQGAIQDMANTAPSSSWQNSWLLKHYTASSIFSGSGPRCLLVLQQS